MRERFLSLKILFAVAMTLTLASGAWASPYSDAVIADNPTAYYRLDETLGSGTAVNSHGAGESGSVNGGVSFGFPGAGSGTGTSAKWDGVDSYIQVLDTNNALDLETGTAFTMEYWMKPTGHRSDDGNWHVLSRSDSDGAHSDSFIVNSGSGASGCPGHCAENVRFHTDGWGGGNHRVDSAANTAVLDQWTHVVGTYNGSNEMALYLDGVQVAFEADITVGPGAEAVGDLFIGTLGTCCAGGADYAGYLDEVAVYNGTALSATQVAAHYAAVPEPSTIVLLVLGPVMLWVLRRSR